MRKRKESFEDEAPVPELVIGARAARITVTVETQNAGSSRTFVIRDFKGAVPGSHFHPKTIQEDIKSALLDRYGNQLNEFPPSG